MTDQPGEKNSPKIKKQVEELLSCRCETTWLHSAGCPALLRPAVLALLERREAEEKQLGPCGVPGHRKSDWNMYDSFCERCAEIEDTVAILKAENINLQSMVAHLERREQEHAAEVRKAIADVRLEGATKALDLWKNRCLQAAEDYITELRAAVQQPELGPCGRHGKEFWRSGKLVYRGEEGNYGLAPGFCTACAQEKAAPGGVSNGES